MGEDGAVTSEYSGGGDPRRTVELLWNVPPPARRGPRPRFTVDRVVATAIGVADTDGFEALSMRRLAEELGVSAMSLYTYVPGKAELIDLMLDRAWGELAPPSGDDWRARLDHIARANWDLYHRHPWMLDVAVARPPLGPHVFDRYEAALTAVDGLGLTDVEMDSVVALVEGFAAAAARTSIGADRTRRGTGSTDAEWWEHVAPVLAEVTPPDRYPLSGRVGEAAAIEYGGAIGPAHAFEFGLARTLDGIAVLVESRSA